MSNSITAGFDNYQLFSNKIYKEGKTGAEEFFKSTPKYMPRIKAKSPSKSQVQMRGVIQSGFGKISQDGIG